MGGATVKVRTEHWVFRYRWAARCSASLLPLVHTSNTRVVPSLSWSVYPDSLDQSASGEGTLSDSVHLAPHMACEKTLSYVPTVC